MLHFNITTNPTTAWTAQQIVEAFPWKGAPGYLLRDLDRIYGAYLQHRVKSMGIEQVVTAPLGSTQIGETVRGVGYAHDPHVDSDAGHLPRY